MANQENETIIELKSISKRYGLGDTESYALHNFDLTVKRGEFIMIMGPSGCGKTTLLNIIGLLDKATSGEYKLAGKPVDRISSRKKARFRAKEIGFIFQSFNLIPNLNVIENVSLPLIYSGYRKTRRLKMADNILEHFHLREREYYMPYQLSGGQQQRVAIARSLIANPSIILADEPTGNLDSRASHIIMEELQEIHSLGNTIIMVTHNPALTTYATRVINMLDGEIDTDIKTVADQDLPQPGDPEKISVRVLSKKRPVELEVESQTKVIVSGKNVTIDEPKVSEKLAKPTALDEENTAKRETKREETKKKAHAKRSRITSILNKAKEKAKGTVKGKSKVKLPSKDKTKSKTKAKTTKKGKEA
jgi:putative ABC transport system ATP-binding protein